MNELVEFKAQVVKDMMTWVKENYRTDLSVQDISNRSGYSTQEITRIFKTFAGVPPGEWLRRLRLDKAKQHLKEGIQPGVTAGMVGYNTLQAFKKAYFKYHGSCPTTDYDLFNGPVKITIPDSVMEEEFPPQLRRDIETYVINNIRKNIRIPVIEEKFKLFEGNLTLMLQHFHGKTYPEWRKHLRMQMAKRKLKNNPSLNLRDLQLMVGYSSLPYFKMHFHEVHGYYPEALIDNLSSEQCRSLEMDLH